LVVLNAFSDVWFRLADANPKFVMFGHVWCRQPRKPGKPSRVSTCLQKPDTRMQNTTAG
jgi:hypothetical protein